MWLTYIFVTRKLDSTNCGVMKSSNLWVRVKNLDYKKYHLTSRISCTSMKRSCIGRIHSDSSIQEKIEKWIRKLQGQVVGCMVRWKDEPRCKKMRILDKQVKYTGLRYEASRENDRMLYSRVPCCVWPGLAAGRAGKEWSTNDYYYPIWEVLLRCYKV